jgi:GT2 family glycosyltransferase
MAKYSIILATLVRKKRHVKMVEKCIDHIKTFSKDYELIIVDDCSPLHAEYLKEQADTYIRHEGGNKGCAVGWNDGLRVATGEYLVIISDDVFVSEGWLECMENALNLFPNALASMPRVANMPAGLKPEECRTWIPASCFMLRKECLDIVGYFDEQFHPYNYEDVDYWTRIYQAKRTVARDYSVSVQHLEGQVIHSFEESDVVDKKNRNKYLAKWGFDPIPILYHGTAKFPWEE